MPQFGSLLGDDILGHALKQRAREHRQAFEWDVGTKNMDPNGPAAAVGLYGPLKSILGSTSSLGPLPDPNWDAFNQAMHERGVDRARQVIPPQNPPTFNPRFQGSAVLPANITSRHFAAPSPQGALSGLMSASPRNPFSIRKVSTSPTRSTGQTRLRVQGQRGGPYAGRR